MKQTPKKRIGGKEMKQLLTALGIEEQTRSKIIEAMKASKIYTTSIERADERYAKLKKQHEALKAQFETAVLTIQKLKKLNNYNEILKTQVAACKDEIKTIHTVYDKQINHLKMDYAIREKLTDFQPKYHDLLIKAFDKKKMNLLEDGTIEGLEQQYEAIKERFAEFHKAGQMEGVTQNK